MLRKLSKIRESKAGISCPDTLLESVLASEPRHGYLWLG
jgi:hypothetical protein